MAKISTAFVDQYEAMITHLSQQKKYSFADKSDYRKMTGERTYVDLLDLGNATKITGRLQQTQLQDADHERRAIVAAPYDLTYGIDENDEYTMIADPKGPYAQNQVAALNRTKDEVFINAALGSAVTGKTGTSTTALPASQKVAVDYVNSGGATNSGLTLAKMIEARRILDANDVDPDEEKYMVVSAQQISDLLNNVDKVSSSDYSQVKALYNGEINFFMGFKFILTNRFAVDANDYNEVFAFTKNSMVFGEHYGIKTRIDERPDLNHAIQVRSTWFGGAVRRDDKGVVSITCDRSV